MKIKNNFFKSIKNVKKIVTAEDHFQDGGFGSWVNEVLNKYQSNIKLKSEFISSETIYKVGSKKFLMRKYGPKI